MEQNQILEKPAEEQPNSESTMKRDNIFVLLSFVTGFAFFEFVLFGGFGIGVPLFFALFYPVAAVYLSRRHKIFTKQSLLTFLPVLILLVCFAVFDNIVLRVFNVIALWICVTFNLLTMSELEGNPIFWAGAWFDILKATFYMPFNNIGKRISNFFGSFKSQNRRNVGIVLLTLLGISPLVILVLVLLASSDAGFERMLNSMANSITADAWGYIGKIILAALLTFPLFNLLYALCSQKRQQKHPVDGFMLKTACLNPLATASALYAFSFIYVLYIALQADYFFSALRGVLPTMFTYAEYARRGFFELAAVVFINYCLIAFAVIITKRKDGKMMKSCRIPVLALVLCTLLLIITAMSKMVMYMGNYGLTPLRVYTSWFMLLLFVLTIFTAIKIIVPHFNFYRFSAVGAIVLYLALNLVNVDGLIAHYNINLYDQSGKLDTQVFYQLSDSAVSEISTLKGDAKYGKEIEQFLKERKAEINGSNWQNFSVSQAVARQAADSQ
jgi:hypothetical protein